MNKCIPVILALSLAVSCGLSTGSDKEKGTLAGVLAGEYAVHPVDTDDMWNVDTAKRSFALARDFYEKKEYDSAIEHYILACKDYTFSIVYYHLGLCLMDAGDYENAKKAFEKSLNLYVDRYTHDLFTFDASDIPRETYFAYYNIACIESLQNNVVNSFNNLSKAVFYGYSYTDHLKNDPDLQNVLSYDNGVYLKAIEERIDNMQYNDEKDFIYNIIDNGKAVMITGYRGTRTDVHIPPLIRDLYVTEIAERAFLHKDLTTVIIARGVTSIEDSAFAFNQITDVIIPPRVTTIGSAAFSNNRLTRVTIPAGLKWISSSAFMSNQLKNVVIEHGVMQAQHRAFMDNKIENLYLPRTLDWIDESAFKTNPVVSVTLGSGVDFLPFYGEQLDHDFLLLYYKRERQGGTYVYEKGKWKLKYRDTSFFDNRLNRYDQPAFNENTGMFYIGDSDGNRGYMTDNGVFWCIENEDYVEIRNFQPGPVDLTIGYFEIPTFINKKQPVKVIGESAFSFYEVKMRGVILPAYAEVIEENAFLHCQIKEIIIPDSVRTIGRDALSDNPFSQITIGADVAFTISESYKDFNTFIEFYYENDRKAGKYVRNYNDDDYEYYWEYEE